MYFNIDNIVSPRITTDKTNRVLMYNTLHTTSNISKNFTST